MSASEFQEILTAESDFLKPLAIHLTRDHTLAEDLYQETLYRALANHDKYHAGSNLKAWLYTIMKNIFINDYRRKRKHWTIFDTATASLAADHPSRSGRNAGESNLRYAEIRKQVETLPEIFRKPFSLYFQGFKYEEIARMLQEPLGTIKSRIHFARKMLKARISHTEQIWLSASAS
ncbi:MAG: RNA polymerase sigma factor [Thermoflavifilum aggregans]|nr:RNA polymerase sigma factor [Thermoflavifilum aggregans]